jgi:transcriptional regulator with XRE-family HTH domain
MTLRDWLRKHETSQADLARRVGVSPAAIARYLSGVRYPRPAIMFAIERATGGAVQPRDLIDGYLRRRGGARARRAA